MIEQETLLLGLFYFISIFPLCFDKKDNYQINKALAELLLLFLIGWKSLMAVRNNFYKG